MKQFFDRAIQDIKDLPDKEFFEMADRMGFDFSVKESASEGDKVFEYWKGTGEFPKNKRDLEVYFSEHKQLGNAYSIDNNKQKGKLDDCLKGTITLVVFLRELFK